MQRRKTGRDRSTVEKPRNTSRQRKKKKPQRRKTGNNRSKIEKPR